MKKDNKAGLLFIFGDILHYNNKYLKDKIKYSEKLITIGHLLQLFEVEKAESRTVKYLLKNTNSEKLNNIFNSEEEIYFLKQVKNFNVNMLANLSSRIIQGIETGNLDDVCYDIES